MTDKGPICLTAGTLVDTPTGEKPVEAIGVGDLVTTLEHGPQPVRMVLRRTISGAELRANRGFWPVCIQAGALGFGLPRRNLWVSPQHRMLYRHIRIPLMFGEDAVFVRAKSLAASFEEVYVDSSRQDVTYIHLVFDRHEVILAEGAASESFHPGPEGLAALDESSRQEILTLFPDLAQSQPQAETYATIRSWELKAMVG